MYGSCIFILLQKILFLPMEYPWNKSYSIGTNRTNRRVECTPTQSEANKNILSPPNEMHFTNGIPMDKCYSTGTNRTNGRVECTPTQPEANGNILSPRNEMHFTIGIPTNGINVIPLVPIVPMDE